MAVPRTHAHDPAAVAASRKPLRDLSGLWLRLLKLLQRTASDKYCQIQSIFHLKFLLCNTKTQDPWDPAGSTCYCLLATHTVSLFFVISCQE